MSDYYKAVLFSLLHRHHPFPLHWEGSGTKLRLWYVPKLGIERNLREWQVPTVNFGRHNRHVL